MKPQTLETLAAWAGGRVLQPGDASTLVGVVGTDSRAVEPGSLFVALKGEKFDAHAFVAEAAERGAAAVMVSREVGVPERAGVILVDDTLTGLQNLARAWRREWGGLVFGITGSNGKTSTKDLTGAVLGRNGASPVFSTKGNLNNHIGLPLSVLACGPEHRVAVLEMGMNHPGEIAPLAAIAEPDGAIITNIGTAHLEYMGSREAIAQEKGMLVEALRENGVAILNANDPFSPSLALRTKAKVLAAGIDAGDVRAENPASSSEGCAFTLRLPDGSSAPVRLRVPGKHMALNAALAAAAGFHLGMGIDQIVAGLESATLTKGRLQLKRAGGLRVLDDTYNANVDSMIAALETLKSFECKGRRVAVLGRMGEIGANARRDHLAVGAAASEHGVDLLVVTGTVDAPWIAEGYLAAGGDGARLARMETREDAAVFLKNTTGPDDLILIKGSRSAGMEKIIELLGDPA